MNNYPVCLHTVLTRADSPIVCSVTVCNDMFCVLMAATLAAKVKSLTAKLY